MLGRLPTHIYLQHDPHLFSSRLQSLLQLLSQIQTVDRFNHIETLDRIFRLIGLQASDEVPLPAHRHLRNFHSRLLHTVFPKKPMPQLPDHSDLF